MQQPGPDERCVVSKEKANGKASQRRQAAGENALIGTYRIADCILEVVTGWPVRAVE